MTPDSGHVALASGVRIAYSEAGSGTRPLVLAHGYTGSRDDWREQWEHLAPLGRTLAIDHRGHGDSSHTGDPKTYHFDQLAADLHETLDGLGVERCDLLGHSMGGMVALRLALAAPARVASLVLMNTAARSVPTLPEPLLEAAARVVRGPGMGALARLLREREREHGRPAAAAERAVQAIGFDAWWERVTAKLEAMDPEAFATLGPALGHQDSLLPRLGEIGCPTLVVVGEEDEPFRIPSEELAAGIPGALLAVIPDAAHSPQIENPGAWRAALREHLARARDATGR